MFEEVDEGHPEEGNGFHYYYNREERLKNAPQIVKDYYDGKMNPPRGFFKVLVSTRANKFLFFTLVVLTAFSLVYGKVMGASSKGELAGIKYELSSFAYDEEVFSSVKVSATPEQIKNPVKVQVTFYLTDADKQTGSGYEEELLLVNTEDYIRLKIQDYEYTRCTAIVKAGSESVQLECSVKR